MRRKVVKHGPSSLTISLPMSWVKKNNIHNGDEIEVTEKDKELLIAGSGKRDSREITVFISGKKPFIKRIFNMPYLRGYDIINIQFDSNSVLENIQNHVDSLLGFEIIEHHSNSCKLKNVAETKPEEFESMLLRMFNVCSSMLEEMYNFVEKNDSTALKRILLMDKTLSRIDLFCRRMINIGSGIPMRKAGSTYATVRLLEEVGDICCRIADHKIDIAPSNKEHFKKIIKSLSTAFSLLRSLRYKGELDLIYEYKELKQKLYPQLDEKRKMNSSEEHMLFFLQQLAYHLHDLSEEVLLWASHYELKK